MTDVPAKEIEKLRRALKHISTYIKKIKPKDFKQAKAMLTIVRQIADDAIQGGE